jgi:hypothetical protein
MLMKRDDGRYEIRCRECELRRGQSIPVGIGLPICSKVKAEMILRNHEGKAA